MKKHWVIPDIHGCCNTLKALVEEQLRPSRHDWIYFLGDYIDRGPDSKGVIDYIMGLQADEYNIRLLKGNHEEYFQRIIEEPAGKKFMGMPWRNKLKTEWFRYGGRETLKSFGVEDIMKVPEKYVEWMRQLEYYIVLDEFVLVHAGLDFELEHPFEDKHSMLWIREFNVKPEKISHRKVIHGHVPVSLDFMDLVINSSSFNFIDLDNGVYMTSKEGFGNLVAWELESGELSIQHNLDM